MSGLPLPSGSLLPKSTSASRNVSELVICAIGTPTFCAQSKRSSSDVPGTVRPRGTPYVRPLMRAFCQILGAISARLG